MKLWLTGKVHLNSACFTCTAGEDYTPFNETIVVRPQDITSINEGLWNYCFDFCTKDDNIVEGDESFYIVITPHTDRVKPFDSVEDRFKITIEDNDSKFFPVQPHAVRSVYIMYGCEMRSKISILELFSSVRRVLQCCECIRQSLR